MKIELTLKDQSRRALTFLILILVAAPLGLAQQPELVVQTNHHGWVQSVALSEDGRILASGDSDGNIKLWDVESRTQIRTIVAHPGTRFDSKERPNFSDSEDPVVNLLESMDGGGVASAVSALAFHPDQKTLASCSTDKTIKLWDLRTGKLKKEFRSSMRVWFISFNKTGDKLLSIGEDNSYSFWDVDSGKKLKNYPPPFTSFRLPWVSPNGELTARYVEDKKTIELVDSAGNTKRVLEGHAAGVRRAVFSPNGKLLASGGWDGTVRLWDLTGVKPPKVLTGHTLFVGAIAFSSDGKLVVSAGGDLTIKLWDVESTEVRTFRGYTSSPNDLFVFGKDDKTLVTATDNILNLWDMEKGRKLGAIAAHTGNIDIAVFDPEKKWLATTDKTVVKISQLAAGMKVMAARYPEWMAGLLKIETLPDLGPKSGLCSEHAIRLLNSESGTITKTLSGHTSVVSSVAFSSDGKKLASGSQGIIKIWDLESEKAIDLTENVGSDAEADELGKVFDVFAQIAGCDFPSSRKAAQNVTAVAFDSKGAKLASGNSAGTLKIWDAVSGRQLQILQNASDNEIEHLEFSEDGTILVSFDDSRTVKVWDVETNRLKNSFPLRDLDESAIDTFKRVPQFLRKLFPFLMHDIRFGIVQSGNGQGQLYDFKKEKTLAWLVALDADDWAVVTPDGQFDTNRLENPEGLTWLLPDAPFTPLSFEIFMRDYYEPQLLPRLLKCAEKDNCGQEFKHSRDINKINRTQPKVAIKAVRPDEGGTVQVLVEVASMSSQVQRDEQGRPLQSGVFDIRLFRDGQMVGESTDEAALIDYIKDAGTLERSPGRNERELALWQRANRINLSAEGLATVTFRHIKLPHSVVAREVEFSAYAFNKDRVKSNTARSRFSLPTADRPHKGRAYIIAVGVNAYENADFNLSFAANDARLLQSILANRLKATEQYEEVVQISLISEVPIEGKGSETRDAKKANFQSVLQVLSGKSSKPARELLQNIVNSDKLRAATPDDLVLILFSSHGYADENGLFYLIPDDTGPGSGKVFTETVRQHSISSDELSLWLRDVDAGQTTLIVDACHSAAAVEGSEFKPGPMGSRGLGQLSYDKGMRILTATQADNIALEHKCIRQGLLTYALIRNGLELGAADFKPRDQSVLMSEWLEFGELDVPKLYQKLKLDVTAGKCKDSDGKPVLVPELTHLRNKVNDTEVKEGKIQQPILFDFTRQRRDVRIANVK